MADQRPMPSPGLSPAPALTPERPPEHPPARPPTRPAVRVWTWPVALGLLSAAGLVSALTVDGWGDAGAWVGLSAPLLVIAWFLSRNVKR